MPNQTNLEYRLVSDRNRSGKAYWRVYVSLLDGKLKKVSTGILDNGKRTSQRSAEQFAAKFIEELSEKIGKPRTIFSEYSKDFWVWGKSQYLRARLARDPKAISPEYARDCNFVLNAHAIPFLGETDIRDIDPPLLDDMVTALFEKGLASQTVKHVIYCISPIFERALSARIIKWNPIPSMIPFAVRHKKRDAFTLEEVRTLLNPLTVETIWDISTPSQPYFNPWKHYGISLLASLSGTRVSAVLALKREDIRLQKWDEKEFYEVSILQSVAAIRGIKDGSKTGQGIVIPIDKEILDPVLAHLPEVGLLFPSTRGSKSGVITHRAAIRTLHAVLVKSLKMTEEEIKARLLGFHSFRHTWETQARIAGLSRHVRAAFTEHAEEETSDIYSHLKAVDLLDALPVQRSLVG